MGDLSKNWSRKEFACKCGCGFDTVDHELITVLQDVIDHFAYLHPDDAVRGHINSGCRCDTHNRKIGGSSRSQHVRGRAADFRVSVAGVDLPADLIADYLEQKYPDKYGIGRYDGRTHVDTRTNGPARWDKR